ncbi:hypothetical protein BLNAU_24801 [Blattamonas nauphoetae]|uniref:Uncharacterized protein n=1 Tax=Blattamonas nauphoetae TaxID=2049346 RepID=A0ABQ9WLF2_9EUKA|nr:hypothetical protein BLNAU_24801 [Blattamonas nauphoetae]
MSSYVDELLARCAIAESCGLVSILFDISIASTVIHNHPFIFWFRLGAISPHLVDFGTQDDIFSEEHRTATWGEDYTPPASAPSECGTSCPMGEADSKPTLVGGTMSNDNME